MYNWLLEYYNKTSKVLNRLPIDSSPFIVGRHVDAPLRINSNSISRNHAAFIFKGNDLLLSDLDSSNGTYVNHQRITADQILRHGDIIHFANSEYRLIRELVDSDFSSDATFCGIAELTCKLPLGLNELQELLNDSLLTAVFQEIVTYKGKSVFGYESLGRGKHPKLPVNPGGLFQLAESSGMAVGLSEMMREIGVELAVSSGITEPLFVNTHPHEIENPGRLLESLFSLRDRYPSTDLVLEIHEEAVADNITMERIKKELEACDIDIAYDDFGSGQARLCNLVETPPDYLKFDIDMIKGIDEAPKAHRRLVESLVKISKDAGIIVTAEGIDNPKDAKTCNKMGFDYLQGYYFSPQLMP